MSDLKIQSPVPMTQFMQDQQFVAWGKCLPATADKGHIIGVGGYLLQGSSVVSAGKTVGYLQPSQQKSPENKNPKFDWLVLFNLKGLEPGNYTLQICAYRCDKVDPTMVPCVDSLTVPIIIDKTSGVEVHDTTSPPNDTNITPDKDYFVAYGDLSGLCDVVDAVMVADGPAIPADYIYSDGVFWCAQFPALAAGTYVLTSTDTAAGTSQISGLVVDPGSGC
ncbi:hypothetical protein [Zavarzinella formosa]|uniref:hypothetical protein n=1 Tax=Zavarzinella formosa TaxID=360055 RepID=UPI0003040010|nr:hypothetical protein [Zavarzinella formosa]